MIGAAAIADTSNTQTPSWEPSNPPKAISFPSGDHAGKSPRSCGTGQLATVLPEARSQISSRPRHPNATLVSSGETEKYHDGVLEKITTGCAPGSSGFTARI